MWVSRGLRVQEGVPGVFREQVQLVRVSRSLGGQGEPLVLWGSRYRL